MMILDSIQAAPPRCVLLLSLLFAACTGGGHDTDPPIRKVPSVNALLNGSCEGSCGDISSDGCYCDDLCERIGDCCADFSQVCSIICPAVDILCGEGYRQIDSDGDGCIDSCVPIVCPEIAILCPLGQDPVDTDGDGCDDNCRPIECTDNPAAFTCVQGQIPIDSDGDGCLDGCGPTSCDSVVNCSPGFRPSDADGDGCPEKCKPICEFLILCSPDSLPVDYDHDGCTDACKVEECPPGEECPTEPPVCTTDDSNSSARYVATSPEECAVIDFGCDEGETLFNNACGCGCVDTPVRCLALPVCEPGEREVSSPDECPADSRCRENSLCGTTIWCSN